MTLDECQCSGSAKKKLKNASMVMSGINKRKDKIRVSHIWKYEYLWTIWLNYCSEAACSTSLSAVLVTQKIKVILLIKWHLKHFTVLSPLSCFYCRPALWELLFNSPSVSVFFSSPYRTAVTLRRWSTSLCWPSTWAKLPRWDFEPEAVKESSALTVSYR